MNECSQHFQALRHIYIQSWVQAPVGSGSRARPLGARGDDQAEVTSGQQQQWEPLPPPTPLHYYLPATRCLSTCLPAYLTYLVASGSNVWGMETRGKRAPGAPFQGLHPWKLPKSPLSAHWPWLSLVLLYCYSIYSPPGCLGELWITAIAQQRWMLPQKYRLGPSPRMLEW